jgi:protein required for attachment to host cells
MSTWMLVANASKADLYSFDNLCDDNLQLIKTFSHPESREKGSDLISDRPGHYQTDHSARSAYEKNDPKEIEAEKFAIELCKGLELDRTQNDYEKLIIVSSPRFYGLIQKHLSKHVPEVTHIPKDYTKCTIEELTKHIHEQLEI